MQILMVMVMGQNLFGAHGQIFHMGLEKIGKIVIGKLMGAEVPVGMDQLPLAI